MKKLKLIITTVVAVALLAGSAGVIANDARVPFGRMHRNKGEFTEEQRIEMKEKMQEKHKEKLASKLENGEITEEQYNEILENIESGKMCIGRRFGKPFGGRGMRRNNQEPQDIENK